MKCYSKRYQPLAIFYLNKTVWLDTSDFIQNNLLSGDIEKYVLLNSSRLTSLPRIESIPISKASQMSMYITSIELTRHIILTIFITLNAYYYIQ